VIPSVCCQTVAEAKPGKTSLSLGAVFRRYGADYIRSHRPPPSHLKAMLAIESCRTPMLGGRLDRCDQCDHEVLAWNSCNDRHCPTCDSTKRSRWLEERRAELLPVPYFHVVFTLDHGLNFLVGYNQKLIYDLLFAAATQTLQQFARNVGGMLGITAILHTWTQQLKRHVHLHCLVPAGMLSLDGSRWIPLEKGVGSKKQAFLFPVHALSLVFREKFLAGLARAEVADQVVWPQDSSSKSQKLDMKGLVQRLRKHKWVVYTKRPLGGPDPVLRYLGRYAYRVAISNERIKDIANGNVTFEYKERNRDNRVATVTVTANDFIERFLLHVVPRQYRRIRHYGLFASRNKKKNIARCFELIVGTLPPSKPDKTSARDLMLKLTGIDIDICPHCKKGALRTVRNLDPIPVLHTRQALTTEAQDSS
jgi:hypothetical protein